MQKLHLSASTTTLMSSWVMAPTGQASSQVWQRMQISGIDQMLLERLVHRRSSHRGGQGEIRSAKEAFRIRAIQGAAVAGAALPGCRFFRHGV